MKSTRYALNQKKILPAFLFWATSLKCVGAYQYVSEILDPARPHHDLSFSLEYFAPISNKQAFLHFMMSHGAVSLLFQEPSFMNVSLSRKLYNHFCFSVFFIFQNACLFEMGAQHP